MLQILTIRLYQNKYLGFLFIVFFIFIGATNLFAEDKIATIVKSLGNSYAINLEGKKRLLNLYDAIYLNEEIITDDKSTLVIQYLDNSTIILKKSSSITLTNFISSPGFKSNDTLPPAFATYLSVFGGNALRPGSSIRVGEANNGAFIF